MNTQNKVWRYTWTYWKWNVWSFGFDRVPWFGREAFNLYLGPALIKFCKYEVKN